MIIAKIRSKLKAHGISGLLGTAFRRVFPRQLACYLYCKPFFKDRIGLEIGGPSALFKRNGPLPLYPIAAQVDNCNFGQQTIWEGAIKEGATFYYDKRRKPGHQYIVEATDLSVFASASYDFVLSSHTLEHVANPLRALSEWIRILKEKGLLVLVVPHKDGTFDHRRPVTLLSHLIQDFEQNTTEGDTTHMEEVLRLHDLSRDVAAGVFETFKQRSARNIENRGLHHHVFDTRLAIEVIHHVGLQILAVEVFRPFHILVIAQKPMTGQAVHNEEFRGIHKTHSWLSPFPSDQLF